MIRGWKLDPGKMFLHVLIKVVGERENVIGKKRWRSICIKRRGEYVNKQHGTPG